MAIVGPQNRNLQAISLKTIRNTQNNQAVPGVPGVVSYTNTALAPVAPPPPAPAPVNFDALIWNDPQFTTGRQYLERQNQVNQDALMRGFRQTAQSYQDNANAHGALFSGAAVNAQNQASSDYTRQVDQATRDYFKQGADLKFSVFQRLLQQLAGVQ